MIRSRAAELQKDPSIGLTWDDLDDRMALAGSDPTPTGLPSRG